MKLVDANVLLYATDLNSSHHRGARDWLNAALSGSGTVLMPWVSLLAFLRIATHPSIYDHPLTVDDAMSTIDAWLARPQVITPEPDTAHPRRMTELLTATGRGGNLVNDAHLAALALQYRATVMTYDNDFGRFPSVRWETPA